MVQVSEEENFSERLSAKFDAHGGRPFTLDNYVERPRGKFPVLAHNDCWFGNVMFRFGARWTGANCWYPHGLAGPDRYKCTGGDPGSEEPEEVLALDFGSSCLLCPGYDLALFFLTSTTGELRRRHLRALLRRYHDLLVAVVGTFAGGAAAREGKGGAREDDVNLYFSFEDLMEDYR